MAFVPGSQAGLPEAAVRRLKDMRGTGPKPKLFTSDLSTNELLLVRKAGFSPIGLVMGSSVYHIGLQIPKQFQSQELEVITQAMYMARELAMTRMEEEAFVLGADGVVGVRLAVSSVTWGENLAEFQAIGTAIKHDAGGNFKALDMRPFTSDLSGQDFYTLLQAGYRPLEMVMGTCVYHVAHQGFRQALQRAWVNTEMENFTQAMYDARELAMSRMQAEAEQEGAVGIVSARVEERSYSWDANIIEYFAVGTAVLEWTEGKGLPEPGFVMTLDN
jgi:uncharacterized protein YbjQ (UPF0145 family)